MKLVAWPTYAAVIAFLMAAPAECSSLTLSGGSPGVIPFGTTVNDYIPALFPGPTIGGYFGAQIDLSVLQGSVLLFEFFGAEAGFHNTFNLAGTERFSHPGGTAIAPDLLSPIGSFKTSIVVAGLLPLSFTANVGGTPVSVTNGSNPDNSSGTLMLPNFFASCNPFGVSAGSGGTTCDAVYLFLDDGGPPHIGMPGLDADYDDFLVRVTAIPEPDTRNPLFAGLVCIALAVRLRRHATR